MQFVPFRKFKDNYHDFAREVLAEIPKQIKDFFEKKGITPKDFKFQNNKNMHRDLELLKRNRLMHKNKDETPYLTEMRKKFTEEILHLGFVRDDVEMIIKKGLHSMDRNIAVD